MRLLLSILMINFIIIANGFSAAHAQTQPPDPKSYEVSDIAADTTADTAVHARDQAIVQAARTGFGQLLQKLSADSTLTAKLSDDDIAALVQNFEVQNERRSAVHYLGTFTIQYKPNAVRTLLAKYGQHFDDTRKKTIIVLPVSILQGHPVLWEETTKWRTVWENAAHTITAQPIVIPAGGLDDIAIISTTEAVDGKNASIKAIIQKYQGDGALVPILNGDPAQGGTELRIEMWRYDADGDASPPQDISLAVPSDKNGADTILTQAVRESRIWLEDELKKAAQGTDDQSMLSDDPAPPPRNTLHLPVTVPIATLAEWAQIQRRLANVSAISRAEIISLARGSTSIEIDYQGTMQDLQIGLMNNDLSLTQNSSNGQWVLRPVGGVGY